MSEEQTTTTEAEEEQAPTQNISLEKFFQDLAKTLKQHEERAKRLIAKFTDVNHKGKPSRKALGDTFQALYDLLGTMNAVERCTMGHTQSIARGIDLKMRGLVTLFVDRGIVSEEELEKTIKGLIEKDEKEDEEKAKAIADEAITQAKEEAAKR